jgi:xylulokinase
MIRSVYEGLACEVRNNIDAAKRSGAEVRRIRAFGGGSRSDIVCRIIADISRTEVQALDFSEMSSFGAAKAAAVACGCEGFDSSGKCRTYLPTGDGEGIFERYMNEQEYF